MVAANFDINTFVIAVNWQVRKWFHIVYIVLYVLSRVQVLCVCHFKHIHVCIYIQAPVIICTANIIMYDITVMDQYSPASVTVPANMSSVEISEFPDNGTSIVANREYTITVSAISDQGTSYPSNPVVVSKY